jgi:hypothetical protein
LPEPSGIDTTLPGAMGVVIDPISMHLLEKEQPSKNECSLGPASQYS